MTVSFSHHPSGIREDEESSLLPGIDHDARARQRDRALGASIASGSAVRLLCISMQLVSVAVAARALGDVRFGLLATLTALLGLMAFADLGIGSGVMTHLALASGRDDAEQARDIVSAALIGMLAFGGLVATLGAATAVLLPWQDFLGATALPRAEVAAVMAVFFLCAGAAIPAGVGQRALVGLQEGAIANLWLLAGAITSLIAVVVSARLDLQLWAFVLATAGVPPLVATMCSVWVLARRHPHLRPALRFVTPKAVRGLAGVSGLFFALNVAVTIAYQTDILIVASTLGTGAAAIFAIGARMFAVLTGTLAAASQQIWTSMAEAMARGDTGWVRSRFTRVLGGTLGISIPAAVVLVAAGRPLSEMWVGRQFVPPLTLLIAFAAWAVYSVTMTQVGYLLNAAQVVKPQVAMAISMALVNVAVSIFLTHRIGIVGPLLGSLISHVVCSGVPSLVLASRVLCGESRLAKVDL